MFKWMCYANSSPITVKENIEKYDLRSHLLCSDITEKNAENLSVLTDFDRGYDIPACGIKNTYIDRVSDIFYA